MTIEDIKNLDKDILTPNDIAPLLRCDPNLIRYQASKDVNSFGFPVCKMGCRIKIPKQAFINWFEGKRKEDEHDKQRISQ